MITFLITFRSLNVKYLLYFEIDKTQKFVINIVIKLNQIKFLLLFLNIELISKILEKHPECMNIMFNIKKKNSKEKSSKEKKKLILLDTE